MPYRTHAQERAHERYAKELTYIDMKQIANLIKNNKSIYIGEAQNDKDMKFCYVQYNHIPYKALYKKTKFTVKLITIYPFDVDEYNQAVDKYNIERAIQVLQGKGYMVVNPDGDLVSKC